MIGFGDDGKVVEGGVAAETAATFDVIERILGRAGADLSHIVRMGVFMTDLADYGEFSAARAERFGDELPGERRSRRSAGLLLGAQIEIDALAFVPE